MHDVAEFTPWLLLARHTQMQACIRCGERSRCCAHLSSLMGHTIWMEDGTQNLSPIACHSACLAFLQTSCITEDIQPAPPTHMHARMHPALTTQGWRPSAVGGRPRCCRW